MPSTQELELISEIQKRECLYNYKDSSYLNKEMVAKCWDEVAKATGLTVCGLPVQVTNSSDAAPCTVSGITYLHSQQITREDPCDFCLCLDGEVFCWWQQQCINTTQQQQLQATTQDNSTTTTSDSEEWFEESGHNTTEAPAPQESMCRVMGIEYKIGEVLPRETGTCLQCQCSPGARVTCSPKDCTSPDQFHALEQQSLDMFDVDVF